MGMTSGAAYSQIRTLRKIAEGLTDLLTFKESSERRNYKRDLRRLEKRGLIVLGGEKIKLSPAGIKFLKDSVHSIVSINIPNAWNGNWHLIAYDIPEKLKYTRNRFRKRLKELEFTRLQGSLWLFPYDCKEEVALLAQTLKIEQYVMYLTTDFVPGQNKYIKKYNLR